MINFNKINHLATILPKDSRMPSNPIIHRLAYCDHTLKLLFTSVDTQNHIAFLVLQPEQLNLLSSSLLHAVHCIIIKGSGVILSSNCSSKTEEILKQLVKWAPYKKVNDNMELYQR